jgi:hypothetical protein
MRLLIKNTSLIISSILFIFAAPSIFAQEVCSGYGPQTPRDIDQKSGDNKRVFSIAPPASEMNLCNIHFHNSAEHKAKDFSVFAGEGEHGGFKCAIGKSLTKAELKPTNGKVCKNLKPGDTIEVHWVHSSCDVKPGKGLGSCMTDTCPNPALRVETQVFTLVNDTNALDFTAMGYGEVSISGYQQAKNIPQNTGKPVEFLGSTTGPTYTDQACSALQVSWSVRPQCAKVDINSVAKWCESNQFEEDHAHGVRKLVTDPSLLSEIE